MTKRYKAFISYSWADKSHGDWLHRALETYRPPKALIGTETPLGPVPERLSPIFKDREETAAGHGVGAAIEAAMAASDFLVVICSPNAAASKWVNHEIAWFKRHKGNDKTLAIVAAGEPGVSLNPAKSGEECFPKTLLYEVDENLQPTDVLADPPLAADARKEGDGKRAAKLKIAAALLGVGLDELVKRDERRRAKQRRMIMGGLGGVAAVMTALAGVALHQRNVARDALAQAEMQRTQAEGVIEYMIGDLTQKLQEDVQLKVLADIAERAREYYAIQMTIDMDDDALGRRARMLDLLGDLENDFGNSETATELFQQSIDASRELLRRDPQNPNRILELAQAVRGLGNIAFRTDDLPFAEAKMRESLELIERLVEFDETNAEWRSELGTAFANIGIIQFRNNKLGEASVNIQRAAEIKRAAIDDAHDERQARYDLSVMLAWLAKTQIEKGEVGDATVTLIKESEQLDNVLSMNPKDLFALRRQALNFHSHAELFIFQGELEEGHRQALAAISNLDQLVERDGADTQNLSALVQTQILLGDITLRLSDIAMAQKASSTANQLIDSLVEIDPARTEWSVDLRGEADDLAERIAAAGGLSAASAPPREDGGR